MTYYCTLADAKNELDASNTVDDSKLRRYMWQVSRRIDAVMGTPRRPYFAPYTEQRSFQLVSLNIDSYNKIFYLYQNLLAVTACVVGSETVTSYVNLYPPEGVAYALRFDSDTDYSWYSNEAPPVFVDVTGVWGWHEDYDNAYASVDTLAAAIVSTTATSFTVTDVDGADLDGFTPRISAGNLLQIDSELMEVTSTTTSTNTVNIRRGRNGTTAATHVIGSAVKVYQVDERIRRIVARQASFLYARRGAYQTTTADGVGTINYPADLLSELRGTLQEFANG